MSHFPHFRKWLIIVLIHRPVTKICVLNNCKLLGIMPGKELLMGQGIFQEYILLRIDKSKIKYGRLSLFY